MSDVVLIPPDKQVSILPTDSFFAYGFGLFETILYANRQIEFWDDHWARLSESARYFSLPMPDEAAALAAIRTYVLDCGVDQIILKVSLVKEEGDSKLYIYSRQPLIAPKNLLLRLDRSCPIFAESSLAGHKTHNYMEAMHLLSLARSRGNYDILRVDSNGFLAETTISNFFFVIDDRVYTPSLDTGILPGVIREALLSAHNLEIECGLFTPDILLAAESIFVTNATVGVQPIKKLVGLVGQKNVEFKMSSPLLSVIKSSFDSIKAKRGKQII